MNYFAVGLKYFRSDELVVEIYNVKQASGGIKEGWH